MGLGYVDESGEVSGGLETGRMKGADKIPNYYMRVRDERREAGQLKDATGAVEQAVQSNLPPLEEAEVSGFTLEVGQRYVLDSDGVLFSILVIESGESTTGFALQISNFGEAPEKGLLVLVDEVESGQVVAFRLKGEEETRNSPLLGRVACKLFAA